MLDFQVRALRSGSSGNLYYIAYRSTGLVLDCGVNGKQFARALAEGGVAEDQISQLKGILVTHEHSDHIQGLGVIMRRYHLPVYMTAGTYQAAAAKMGKVDEALIHIIESDQAFAIGDLWVQAFPVSHDAAQPVGYSLTSEQTKVSFCTDTGIVGAEILKALKGSDLAFIEANYEPGLLDSGPYPYPLKQRIKSERGHLSNLAGAELCGRLLQAGTEQFVLAHLSQENNYPALARLVVEDSLSELGAEVGKDYSLAVANRYQASAAISL
ncbi:MAG: MBL fold metallo-hydrolase [Eubacteriales bacterium]|nr:MBL fold metallo-hydrolase [Eubacteriales bacterium]